MQLKSTLLRSMLPGLLPMLPEAMESVEAAIRDRLAQMSLEEGEARAVYLLMKGAGDKIYIVEAFLNPEDAIKRIASAKPAAQFIEELIQKVK